MGKKKEFRVSLLLALIVLISNPVWFLWNIRFYIVAFLVFLLVVFLLPRLGRGDNFLAIFRKISITFLFFVYFVIISSLIGGFQLYVLISFVILLLYPLIKDKEKEIALKMITKMLAVIVFVSFIPWVVNTFIIQLPMLGGYIEYYDTKGMDSVIENYILFIQIKHDFLIRFYSIFDEPGTLGTLSAFILYANRFDFRQKQNIIILIGGCFTFSMAFYILMLLGLLIVNLNRFKRIVVSIIYVILFVIFMFLVLENNETFKTVIIDRFQNVNSSLENRESFYLNYFYDYFVNSSEIWFGIGRDFILSKNSLLAGQSYKFFIIEFGLFGFLCAVITYLSMVKKINLFQLGLFILFFVSFIQRPFLIQPWQILLFILIIGSSEINKNFKHD